MPARETESMDEFINHKTTERFRRMDDWKEKGKLDTFPHRRINPVIVPRHNIPTVFVQDDDGDPVRRCFRRPYVCYEHEAVVKKQGKLNKAETREVPTLYCGLCRVVDTVRMMVVEGQLDWLDPIFRFTADNPEETTIIHAGGFCNMFSDWNLDDDKKKVLREAGINLKEAWKEDGRSKISYVLAVVLAEKPEAGVQITVETGLLGDKIKECISDEIESKGKEKGNPQITPYCIRWVYKEDEKNPQRKYAAKRIDIVQPTDQIIELISGPKPDVSMFTKLFDQKLMRATLEEHCISKVALPWDEIFAVKPLPEEASKSTSSGKPEPSLSSKVSTQDTIIPCDKCGVDMKASDTKCSNCGQQYEVTNDEEPVAPPPPKTTGRSSRRGK